MLLERESALAELESVLSEVDSGDGAVVVIGGAAGAGTTALLRQLATTAGRRGARVLLGGGAETETGYPFGVVRQLVLPPLSAPDDPELPLAARKVLQCLASGAAADLPPSTVLPGLHALIAGFAAHRTVVLLVDDLPWADEPSLRALVFLAARLCGLRLLIGVVIADGTGGRSPLLREIAGGARHHVRVAALSPAATGKLIGSRFGAAHDPEFSLACHEITGGNPKELSSLLDRALGHRLSGRADEAEQIRALGGAVWEERLRSVLRRDPAVAALAKAVVVLGNGADHRLVAQLSGLEPPRYAAARAVLEGLFLTAPEEVLAPRIVRLIEEAMSPREDAALRNAAAILLAESGYPVEQVVGQFGHGGGRGEAAALRVAAAEARQRGEPEAATRYLRQVLRDRPKYDVDRPWLLAELAAAEFDAGAAVAVRHLAQAASLMRSARDRAAVIARSPLSVAAAGPLIDELVREVSEELGPAEKLHGADRELALRLEARAWYAALADPARQAAAMARLRSLPGTVPLSAAERDLRSVLLLSGTLSARLSRDEVAAPIAQILDNQPAHRVDMQSTMWVLPTVLVAAGDLGGALGWLEAASDYTNRRSSAGWRSVVDAQRALVLLAKGHLAEGREHAVRAYDAVALAEREHRILPEQALGVAAFMLRDSELAGRLLGSTEPDGLPWQFLIRRALLATVTAEQGDLEEALAQFLDCERYLDRMGWCNPVLHRWWEGAAMLSHRLGRAGQARRVAEESHERAVAWGEPVTIARTLRIRAAVHDGAAGVRWLRESLALLEESDNPFELAYTLVDLGERLRETDPAEAARHVLCGHRLAAQCGAGWLAERADRLYASSADAPDTPRRPGLTPGETTVAELAAQGRTNTEIAETLGIGRRAVEKRLTGVYRKLRIEGRPGLAGALGPDRSG
ncbi:AAA family ATPase [Amycolatopsis jejuensis]|uniref:AAA family ATPase n=1 Tax=Amycolatopsis jejuensis TaxID=330084 RepID=UPI00068C9DCB|nr:AAA family ATPase [Amycolatopsis jejuensis]